MNVSGVKRPPNMYSSLFNTSIAKPFSDMPFSDMMIVIKKKKKK